MSTLLKTYETLKEQIRQRDTMESIVDSSREYLDVTTADLAEAQHALEQAIFEEKETRTAHGELANELSKSPNCGPRSLHEALEKLGDKIGICVEKVRKAREAEKVRQGKVTGAKSALAFNEMQLRELIKECSEITERIEQLGAEQR
jgi:chromosome segregation ATPase